MYIKQTYRRLTKLYRKREKLTARGKGYIDNLTLFIKPIFILNGHGKHSTISIEETQSLLVFGASIVFGIQY